VDQVVEEEDSELSDVGSDQFKDSDMTYSRGLRVRGYTRGHARGHAKSCKWKDNSFKESTRIVTIKRWYFRNTTNGY
jgi:hypothetical protein